MDHMLHSCKEVDCTICLGGLDLCETCGGAEAAMPTDCPGVKMTADQLDAVQNGDLDFREGGWVRLK